jgi:hypothetical protein
MCAAEVTWCSAEEAQEIDTVCIPKRSFPSGAQLANRMWGYLYVRGMRTEKKGNTKAPTDAYYGDSSGCAAGIPTSRPYRYHHQVSSNMQSKQTKHLSFRQTARSFFSTFSDNPAPIRMSHLGARAQYGVANRFRY